MTILIGIILYPLAIVLSMTLGNIFKNKVQLVFMNGAALNDPDKVFNTGLAAANSAQIAGLTLTRTGGTVCTASIAPGTFPLSVGPLIPGASAFGDVIINFTGCDNTSKFRVNIALSANAGATTGAVVQNNVRK